MPRLTKIRITGCKYDGFRKSYENSVFDLTRDNEPDHCLFTLKNQGGKGVLIQLLSQIGMPETRWGKQDGNKMTSFFYDRKGRFNPYTFHVILEWKLDSVPEKWLISGICITSYVKDSHDEEEKEHTGLRYFMYTYEHENKGYLTVENLPAYNFDKETTAQYEEYENFIDQNKRDIVKYSQASSKRQDSPYYKYLKSNGIFKSEWEILKLINKVEGGSSEYFSKASDNKSIFDKTIIPAITENLKNASGEEKSDLKNMFKSHLSITKNLPTLLEREEDHKYLIQGINPVIEDVGIGIRRQELYKGHVMKGNNLLFAINNIKVDNEKNIEKWKEESRKASEKKKELEFQMQSFEYMKIMQQLEEYHKEKKEYNTLIEEKELSLKDTIHERLRYKTSSLLNKRDEYIKDKQQNERKRQILMDSDQIQQTISKAEELEQNIASQWNDVNKRWEEIKLVHYGHISFIDNEISLLRDKKDKAEEQEKNKAIKIEIHRQKKQQIEQTRTKLAIIHGSMQMQFPDRHIEELSKQLKSFENEIEKTDMDLKKTLNKMIKIQAEISSFEKALKDIKENLKQLDADFISTKKEEEILKNIISSELDMDRDMQIYSSSWLVKNKESLEKMKSEKSKRLAELKESLWELNIDLNINNADYWIPNPDAASLKEKISSLNINVQLGTQYLHNLKNEEEILKITDENPLFIYGLVIASQSDMQIIRKNIDSDIFLKNAVPIFIRSNMKDAYQPNFEIIKDFGFRLSRNQQEFINWKSSLVEKKTGTEVSIRSVQTKIEKIESLMQDIMIMQNNVSSKQISEKISEKTSELSRLESAINETHQKLSDLNERESSSRVSLKDQQKKLKQYETELNELIKFHEELQEFEAAKNAMDEEIRLKQELEELIKTLKSKIEQLDTSKKNDESQYTSWHLEVQNALKRLAKAKVDADFDKRSKVGTSLSSVSPSYRVLDSAFEHLLEEYETLNMQMEQKNSRIAVVNNDIEHNQKDISATEDELSKLNKSWKEFAAFDISGSEHQIKIEFLDSKITQLENLLSKIHNLLSAVDARIEMTENIREKKEKHTIKVYNRPPLIWKEQQLVNKEYNINKEIDDNNKFIKNTEDILNKAYIKREALRDILSDLKQYAYLDLQQGNLDQNLPDSILENPQNEVEEWKNKYAKIYREKTDIEDKIYNGMENYKNGIEKNVKEQILRERILEALKDIGSNRQTKDLSIIFQTFESMKNHFEKEMITVSNDKQRAEEVRDQWAQRAARHVIVMTEALKSMISGMTYQNEGGYLFPLVKLSEDHQLPKNENEIMITLKDYFIESIKKLIEQNQDIENIDDNTLDKIMGDQMIFSRAVRGRYPKLMVYKMTEKNEFRHSRPHESYYTTWEAINKGEGDMTEGSGGQTVSVHTFVIMMLMNYKKKDSFRQNPWTVLILDNPFGKASGNHMLDPIFEIADKLNFQIIAFAAPEIIKVDISERFPVFWALNISESEDKRPGSIAGKVIHGGRVIKKQ